MTRYRKPHRIKKKKSILKSRIFWIPFFSLVFFLGIFYLIFFSSFFQIREIKISGNLEVRTKEIEDLVLTQISKNIIFFPNRSIFLFDSKKVSQSILDSFPQIEKANFKKNFPDKLKLEIKERNGLAIFCQAEKCFLIDGEGIIFKEISSQQEFRIESLKEDQIKLGRRIIEKELLSKILSIKDKLDKDFKIPLEKIAILSDERINVKTLEGWEIYFNPKKDIDWQLVKLKAVLDEEVPPQRRKDLEYIELRFGNFAPYKYRGD